MMSDLVYCHVRDLWSEYYKGGTKMFSHGHKTDRIYDGMSVSYAVIKVER